MNYYNENNPACAHWLRELIAQKLIPPGHVDERSIVDVTGTDLAGFTQCHWFAGISGWSLALRLAGWPDDKPVWTGSCPCQPFSCAGQGRGTADPRHLWPQFFRLISECKPATVFGEQVASAAGRLWLSGVRADLETLAYAVGASDLCAAGISAPMVSQRLHWVASSDRDGFKAGRLPIRPGGQKPAETLPEGNCEDAAGLAETDRYHQHWWSGPLQVGRNCLAGEIERGGRKYGAQWRVKPGLSLLADGIPGRVDQLCGFGNAIVPQLAAEFIQACEEAREALI